MPTLNSQGIITNDVVQRYVGAKVSDVRSRYMCEHQTQRPIRCEMIGAS